MRIRSAPPRTYYGEDLPCGCPGTRQQTGGALGDYAANHGDGSAGAAGRGSDFYYGGNGTGVIISSRVRCSELSGGKIVDWIDKVQRRHVKDGMSHTTLVGEKHIRRVMHGAYPDDAPMYDGDHLFASARVGGPQFPIGNGAQDGITDFASFGSWHRGICNFVMADSSVQSLNNLIDTTVLGRLCNRADGHIVALP